MKIIIAGAGEVGSHLAKLLSNEEQDITLIDQDASRLATIDANFNLMTVTGNPTSFATLREARVEDCDLFIGVTPYETNNFVACAIAKNLGAKLTVARIDSYDYMDPENFRHVRNMGVDKVIYPEYLAAKEILTNLEYPWLRSRFELHEGQIILVGVRLLAGAPLDGVKLKDFAGSNHSFHVSLIRRDRHTIIPRGDDAMHAGDTLYFTTTRERMGDLLKLTGQTELKVRRVLVMGGGKITVRLLNMAADSFKIKVIDSSYEVCQKLAQRCPGVEVIHGDARDSELLADCGIDDTEAFVALSNSSEANILTCLTAREAGANLTIAEVENTQFINQAEGLNISGIVNKKLLASGAIFQLLLNADSSTAKCLALPGAEVAELEVKKDSRITHAPVKDLRLSRDMTLVGLIRDGKGMLIGGNTHIAVGDIVLVICLGGSLPKVERLFK